MVIGIKRISERGSTRHREGIAIFLQLASLLFVRNQKDLLQELNMNVKIYYPYPLYLFKPVYFAYYICSVPNIAIHAILEAKYSNLVLKIV